MSDDRSRSVPCPQWVGGVGGAGAPGAEFCAGRRAFNSGTELHPITPRSWDSASGPRRLVPIGCRPAYPDGGHSLVSSVPMRDQRIVEHTLNSVIDIYNLTPLFTVFALKCDPFHCVPSKSTPFHCSQLKHWNAIILLYMYMCNMQTICLMASEK